MKDELVDKKSISEFSYISKEKRIRKLSGVFLLEIVVFVIAGVLILVLLNYLNLIDLRKINFGLNILPSKDNFRDNKVIVNSEIEGIAIKLKDKEALLVDLKNWGVLGGKFVGGYGILGSTKDVPVRDIKVTLTDKEQQINQFVDKQGQVYVSSISIFSPGLVEFVIHVSPKILNDLNKKDKIGQYFETQLLTTAFRLVHPPRQIVQFKASEQQLADYLVQKNKKKENYFDVNFK